MYGKRTKHDISYCSLWTTDHHVQTVFGFVVLRAISFANFSQYIHRYETKIHTKNSIISLNIARSSTLNVFRYFIVYYVQFQIFVNLSSDFTQVHNIWKWFFHLNSTRYFCKSNYYWRSYSITVKVLIHLCIMSIIWSGSTYQCYPSLITI